MQSSLFFQKGEIDMDYETIQKIIRDFEASKLQSLELEWNDLKIKMAKPEVVFAAQPVHSALQTGTEPFRTAESTTLEKPKGHVVKSPLVGTFFAATSPDAEPFVKVGDTVKKGDTLCIIEAMKIMNDIAAPVSGRIAKIHAKNGEAVGFEQTLFTIDDSK
jgi:acetyl-CoA carboxylase biotin carboxyl carrier protein